MRELKYIYLAGTVVLALLLSVNAAAQSRREYHKPAALELLKAKALWFNSNNGAGLTLDRMTDFNNLNVNYRLKNGNFKKVYEGEQEQVAGVSTEEA
ncbi:hypothetical protein MASR1M46_11590 [Bacteroidales bacterium]